MGVCLTTLERNEEKYYVIKMPNHYWIDLALSLESSSSVEFNIRDEKDEIIKIKIEIKVYILLINLMGLYWLEKWKFKMMLLTWKHMGIQIYILI